MKFLKERKQRKILKSKLPQILAAIDKEQKYVLSKDNILSELKNGKLFGVAGEFNEDGHHFNYKFTVGVMKNENTKAI